MKTFNYPIKELFNKGLRVLEESPRNGRSLTAVTNARLSKGGLIQADKLTRTAFALNETAQVFSAYIGTFVLTVDTLYSWSDPNLTQLLTGLTSGGEWSMADFGDYVLFTNGSVNLIRDSITGTFATDAGIIFPLATSICKHRGRLILGGPKDYPNIGDTNTNWMIWSDINNLDFLHTPILSTTIATLATQVSFTLTSGSAVDDAYNDMIAVITDAGDDTIKAYAPILDYTGSTKTVILNVDPAIFTIAVTDKVKIIDDIDNNQARQNLAGYMPMPWEGNIQKVIPLGDKVVVYGDNGVTGMRLISSDLIASSYGQIDIHDIGLVGQAAVCTTGKEDEGQMHYYVDSIGWLNKIDNSLKSQRIGYKEFLSNSALRLSFNPIRDELYCMSSATLTYVYSDQGMYAISTGIDSTSHRVDTLLIHSVAAIAQDNITFSTDVINFNAQGIKALEWLQLNVDCPDDIFITVRYRKGVNETYSTAQRKQFNKEGVCRIGVRGVDFILDFDIPSYAMFQLESMLLSVQFVDRRFRRGVAVEGGI